MQKSLTMVLMGSYLAICAWAEPRTVEADVVIYGSTPAGVTAAVAAADQGVSVLLVSEGLHVGGMIAQGGLTASDIGNAETVGGMAEKFFRTVYQHYVDTYGEDSPQAKVSGGGDFPGERLEPKVGEMVFDRWLQAARGVQVERGLELRSVDRDGARLREARFMAGDGAEVRITGRVFIDATYTGDLMAAAKVSYRIGREARSEYLEPLGYDHTDAGVMGYNYRVTLTDDPANRLPIVKPANYDPARYAHEVRRLQVIRPQQLMGPVFRTYWRLPNNKQDSNLPDLTDVCWEYPDATPARRREIEAEYRDYALGFLYLLQNDPSIPAGIREPSREWGLPRDEFEDNGNFPRQIYVREARRMLGDYVLTQHDLTEHRFKSDAVALGSYAIDSHRVTRRPDRIGPGTNMGSLFEPVRPYEIPYRVLLPQRDQAENLLVPVCVSSTHVAWCSLRMEPVFMMLGEAAGVAAAMSLDAPAVHDVSVDELRERLAGRGAKLSAPEEPRADFSWTPQTPRVGEKVRLHYRASERATEPVNYFWDIDGDGRPDRRESSPEVTFDLAKSTLVSLVVEDARGARSNPSAHAIPVEGARGGDRQLDMEASTLVPAPDVAVTTVLTTKSNDRPPFYGVSYSHDRNDFKGRGVAGFHFTVEVGGRYRVFVSGFGPERSTHTPVKVSTTHQASVTKIVDQSQGDPHFGLVAVGEFDFAAGEKVSIDVSNEGTTRTVVYDIARLVLIAPR